VLCDPGSKAVPSIASPTASAGSTTSRSASSASGSSCPSTYARRKPGKAMTRPLAVSSASTPASTGASRGMVPASRTWALVPVASAICEATVRFQMRS